MCSKGKCLLKCCGGIRNVSSTATNIVKPEAEQPRVSVETQDDTSFSFSSVDLTDKTGQEKMSESKTRVHINTETREASTSIDKTLIKSKRPLKRLYSTVKHQEEVVKPVKEPSRRIITDSESREFGARVFSQIAASTANLLQKDEQKVWDETAENVADLLRSRESKLKQVSGTNLARSTSDLDKFIPAVLKKKVAKFTQFPRHL